MQEPRGASLTDATTVPDADDSASPRPRRLPLLFAVVAGLVVVVDQAAKALALSQLAGRAPVELAGGALTLRLVRNPGAAFGTATGFTALLTVVALVVVAAIVRASRRLGSTGWAVALGLILGGAVGNLVDRFVRDPGPLRGHVVDFLELPRWPVFNLADSAICVGAALIVLLTMLGRGLDGSTHRRGGHA